MIFPYYSGKIQFTKCLGFVNLYYLYDSIQFPNHNINAIFEAIQEATSKGDLKLKRELKHKLYSFTPSVIIPKRMKRNYSNISRWTGIMQVDLDGLAQPNLDIEALKLVVWNDNPELLCLFISPSGKGIKGLLKTTIPRDKEHYKALHKAYKNERWKDSKYFDNATKNAVLPMFLSRDRNILTRSWDETKTWEKEDWSQPKYVQLNNVPPPTSTTKIDSRQAQWDYKRTVRIITEKISNIVDNGHPQVCDACLTLGSRVAAGYIDHIEAENLVMSLIENNIYLSKGTSGYIKTAIDMINKGYDNGPRYYK